MDLGAQFILLVIFAFIGFITYQVWGFDVYKLYSDIGSMVFIVMLFSFVLPVMLNPYGTPPEEMESRLGSMVNYFAEALPGMVVGDIAGTFVSAMVGERR